MNASSARSVVDMHKEQLELLHRANEGGSELALVEALFYCDKYGVIAPRWVLRSAARALVLTLRDVKPKRRAGRAAQGLARERQNLIHYLRWDAVNELREARENWRHQRAALEGSCRDSSAELRKRLSIALWKTDGGLDPLFEVLAALLAKPVGGRASTIRASYQRVEREMKSPRTAHRYCLFEPQILRAVGMTDFLDSVSARKLEAFFVS